MVFQDHRYSPRICSTALDTLDRWPEKVRLMQRNWIGRSEGLLRALRARARRSGDAREVEVYTTRPDTLFGAKFVALAADHPLAKAAARARSGARRLLPTNAVTAAPRWRRSRRPKRRAIDTGLRVVHPFDPDWLLPVYVANFVLMDYGTGAIFGCPAHDQRDLDFANTYGLGATPVVCPAGVDPATSRSSRDTAFDGEGG